ncbi:hypothetical protein C7974DRAFT_138934 [Boeremia exigua]|uniref:uncharacterized protein n=1 Tax=Boeremia exigua TaxID=749465 RepID=UPI001E8EDBE8|nr:uncharacterized protein C7974DRAFT_138934 [Boeremia exigua]KAH6639791.1 hypothetical protein C7974DRAFT_138934 [Boeremia exigua]
MTTIEATPAKTVRATKTCFSRKDFVDEWTFPTDPLHDFGLHGIPASYARDPRHWGDETHCIDFSNVIKDGQSEHSYDSYYAAISHDHKLLAITSKHERIIVYDLDSRELRQVLDGAGHLIFAPLIPLADRKDTDKSTPAYTICCSTSDESSRSGIKNQLVFWELDGQGRLLNQEEPIDASALAQQAIDAILPDLMKKHEWSKDFVKASSLHADFMTTLGNVATVHRRRHNMILDDAKLGGFGSTSFNSDGRLFLYHTKNQTTQSGMRDPNLLPQVVVMDVTSSQELHRLSGHTDAIMWSATSPNNNHIASVAWDGDLRMYSAKTGELEWSTTGGGQSWTGAFSADSKHIVWSTGNGQTVVVHEVKNGKRVSSCPKTFRTWCRSLAWHPDGQQIALCAGKDAYVWRPFEADQSEITQHYQIEDESNWGMMASVESVDWLANGRLLHLHFSDGTNLVYDTETNTKELFMHPKGLDSVWVSDGFYGHIDVTGIQGGHVSVDGDGKIRYWSTEVIDRGF